MQFTLPEQSDWCDNMPLRSYNYAPVLPVNVSRPYFLTRPQGVRKKFGVWEQDYTNVGFLYITDFINFALRRQQMENEQVNQLAEAILWFWRLSCV